MRSYSDIEIIEGLRKRDQLIMKYLFHTCFMYIRSLAFLSGKEIYNPNDLFNDGLLILLKQADKTNFVLTCSLKTYFYRICRLLVSHENHLNNRKEAPVMLEFDEREEPQESFFDEYYDRELMFNLIKRHLLRMMRACKRVLNLQFQSFNNLEISRKMKRSYEAVRKLKSKCKKKLLEAIYGDPEYRRIRKNDELM